MSTVPNIEREHGLRTLSVAAPAVPSKSLRSTALSPSTAFRSAQVERHSFSLEVSKYTNVMWNDLERGPAGLRSIPVLTSP